MKACRGHRNELAESHTGLVENEPVLLNPHLECSESSCSDSCIRVLRYERACVSFRWCSQRGRIDVDFADPQKVQQRARVRLPICGRYTQGEGLPPAGLEHHIHQLLRLVEKGNRTL